MENNTIVGTIKSLLTEYNSTEQAQKCFQHRNQNSIQLHPWGDDRNLRGTVNPRAKSATVTGELAE